MAKIAECGRQGADNTASWRAPLWTTVENNLNLTTRAVVSAGLHVQSGEFVGQGDWQFTAGRFTSIRLLIRTISCTGMYPPEPLFARKLRGFRIATNFSRGSKSTGGHSILRICFFYGFAPANLWASRQLLSCTPKVGRLTGWRQTTWSWPGCRGCSTLESKGRHLPKEDECPNHNHIRVPRAYADQSIHAQTMITFVFQEHTVTRASMPKPKSAATPHTSQTWSRTVSGSLPEETMWRVLRRLLCCRE